MEDKKYSAIVAIVNHGFIDLVMNAATNAGARGGTIISARGTGNKDFEKFFGIVVSSEKEIAIIIVDEKIKDKVLLAINNEAGMQTNGKGIAFSLPVEDVVGLLKDDSNKPDEQK